MKVYEEFVLRRLAEDAATPDDIVRGIEKALHEVATDWGLYSDGHWRKDTVCSICGSWVAGICGHQGDPTRRLILRREYEAMQP